MWTFLLFDSAPPKTDLHIFALFHSLVTHSCTAQPPCGRLIIIILLSSVKVYVRVCVCVCS